MSRFEDHANNEKRKPLRTYSDSSPKKKGWVSRRIEAYWYFLHPILFLLLIISLGITAAWGYYNKTPYWKSQTIDSNQFLRADRSINQNAFLTTYFQTKGILPGQIETLQFSFRGTYSKENKMIGFAGEADLSGNGLVNLAWDAASSNYEFEHAALKKRIDSLQLDDHLAIDSLVCFFEDPLIAYASNSKEFIAQMALEQEFGIEVIHIDLLHNTDGDKYAIRIDAKSLQILRITKTSDSGILDLRFYGYQSKDGVLLPSSVTIIDSKDRTLPIVMSHISRLR